MLLVPPLVPFHFAPMVLQCCPHALPCHLPGRKSRRAKCIACQSDALQAARHTAGGFLCASRVSRSVALPTARAHRALPCIVHLVEKGVDVGFATPTRTAAVVLPRCAARPLCAEAAVNAESQTPREERRGRIGARACIYMRISHIRVFLSLY